MATQRGEFPLHDALLGIVRYYRRGLVFFVAVVVCVGLATLAAQKSFRSEAKLFVRLGRENVGLDATTTLGHAPSVQVPLSREDEINSVAEIIRSRAIIEQVVDEVGADRIRRRPKNQQEKNSPATAESTSGFSLGNLFAVLPDGMQWLSPFSDISNRERTIIHVGKKLSVKPFDKSTVIRINYEAYSPELAQEVVDSVVRHYVDKHARLHRTPHADEFLEDQRARLQADLTGAENELETLKNRAGIFSPAEQRKALVDRLARLEDELLSVEASAAATEAEVTHLRKKLQALDDTRVVSQTTGAGNEAVDGMREELFRLQSQQQDLLTKFAPDHYAITGIRERINALTKILADEESERTETIQGPSKLFEETLLEIIRKEPLLAALRVKQIKLRSQLDETRAGVEAFTRDELEYTKLNREVELTEASYRRYSDNLEQAMIDRALEDADISNIGIAQPATLQPKQYRPNKFINLILGLGLGGFGGLGLAVLSQFYDRTLVTDEDVESTLELPLVASLPKQRHLRRTPATSHILQRGTAQASTNGSLSRLDQSVRELIVPLTTAHGSANGSGPSRVRTMAVTSCQAGEGVTTVATRCAIMAASAAAGPVLLVDADLEQPTLQQNFGLQANPGLLNCLEQNDLMEGALQDAGYPQLCVMTAGCPEDDLTIGRDRQDRLQSLLTQLQERFELIIFDFPAATGTNRQLSWLECFDATFLVVESERTLAETAKRTKRRIVDAGGRLRGVIHNKQHTYLTNRWFQE